MSLESTHRSYSSPDGYDADDETGPDRPETGSVWWVELSLGALCLLSAGAVALARTSVGPLSSVRFVYGTIPAALYLVVATAIGLSFLQSGIQRTPDTDRLR